MLSVILLCNFCVVGSTILKVKYKKIGSCDNHAPTTITIFLTKSAKKALQCSRYCQMELSCRSFGFNINTRECYLSSGLFDSCDQLEAKAGSVTYKVRNNYFGEGIDRYPISSLKKILIKYNKM